MADIVLSCNDEARDTVLRLAETLKSVGWSAWWDRRIPAGGTWRQQLERELQAMRCMVVVWSSNSVKSDWVCEEATEGRLQGCLMPVCIEAVKPPAGFREVQAADLGGWDGAATFIGMRTLIEDIRQRIGAPVIAATPTVETIPQPVPPPVVAKIREAPAASPPAPLWLLAVGGLALCFLWRVPITSYRNLNTARWLVKHQIEKRLPISPYDAEWEAMGRGKNPELYKPISHIEMGVPLVFAGLHEIVLMTAFP